MDRHFLIAVSDQKSAAFGVRFVSDFFSDKHHVRATLFYSAPEPPKVWSHERNLEKDRQQQKQQAELIKKGKQALDNAHETCMKNGFDPENVSKKVQGRIFSKVADIIQEGENGRYDAVVLGRRGLSMIEEAFEDSVSKSIYKARFSFPLWLCRSADPARKNVLLYVDGTDASRQMVDHVGFVLSLENRHHVDLVISNDIPERSPLIPKYINDLEGNGVAPDHIRVRFRAEDNPARQILDLVEKESYAAVALGRQGRESGLFARLFKGPVCSVLFRELNGAALWLCP